MIKNTFKNRFLFVRYIIYFAIASSILILGNTPTKNVPKLLFFLLLYIINTQIRIYFLKANRPLIICDLLIELIIIYLLCSNFGGFTFVYYFITILDASIMLSKIEAILMISITSVTIIVLSLHPNYSILQNYPMINAIFNTLIVIGFIILGGYIKEEQDKKKEAQKLYDQIRISEEKLKDAYNRLEQYSTTVEEITILRERNRISREIHDTVGHTLSTLIIQLQSVPFIIDSNPAEAKNTVNDMAVYTKTGLEDVRRAVRELKPSSFDNSNGMFVLKELFQNFEKSSKIKINYTISKNEYALTPDQSFTLYRVFQESFNNSLRHGEATVIDINISFLKNQLYIRIKDNGKGCSNFVPIFGLSSIQERIKNIGGNVTYTSKYDNGFEINILIPSVENIAALD